MERPGGKRTLGRPRCRWGDIKTNLREMGSNAGDWMGFAQDETNGRLTYSKGGNEPPCFLKSMCTKLCKSILKFKCNIYYILVHYVQCE